jgi:tetratricopeptide (TPR) repeat protein
MPDAARESLLRDAAALARQGKLDQAVKQYESALELSPDDWSTANLVGDLWLKLGDADAAKRHFDSAANRLADEGFHAKASALFKKILKIWPDDDNARVRAAEIAERQELYADADAHYRAAIAARRARGDAEGAQALEERIRVRAAVEEAAAAEAAASAEDTAAAPGATRPAPAPLAAGTSNVPEPAAAPVAGPSAAERWAASVALTSDGIAGLVAGLEIGPPRVAAVPPPVPHSTASWAPPLVTDVVGGLDRVDTGAEAETSEAARLLATLGAAADGWRELVRIAVRPEWVAALEARQRVAAEREPDAPADEAFDLSIPAAEPVALEAAPEMAISTSPVSSLEPLAADGQPAIEAAPPFETAAAPAAPERPSTATGDGPDVNDINAVFEYLRATFAAAHTMQARDWLTRGRAWLAAGDLASGIPALERATSASTLRSEAATLLGRHYLHAGNPAFAVQWLERAAECPAADEKAGQALVYDIGCALEDLGEDLRALAVFTELRRAAGGSWADVNQRIDRLSGLA